MITYFSNIDMILYVLVYVIWYNHLCNITILIPQLQPAKIFCCNDFLPRKICVWIVFLQTAEKDTAVCGLGQWINRLRARDGFWVSVQECLSSYGENNGPYRPYRLQRLASVPVAERHWGPREGTQCPTCQRVPARIWGEQGHGSTPEWMVEY